MIINLKLGKDLVRSSHCEFTWVGLDSDRHDFVSLSDDNVALKK